jgi:hypothetical protein
MFFLQVTSCFVVCQTKKLDFYSIMDNIDIEPNFVKYGQQRVSKFER